MGLFRTLIRICIVTKVSAKYFDSGELINTKVKIRGRRDVENVRVRQEDSNAKFSDFRVLILNLFIHTNLFD